jgi:hypothetical protein
MNYDLEHAVETLKSDFSGANFRAAVIAAMLTADPPESEAETEPAAPPEPDPQPVQTEAPSVLDASDAPTDPAPLTLAPPITE